ncbi:MAG TPA: DUF192 domain-containing protein [Armatimonadota bacterium]|jgi:hypothetical protein
MRITDKRNGRVVARDAVIARSIIAQLKGLMCRREFPEGSALIIPGCRQVHTFFVWFPLDLVFVDKAGKAVRIVEGIRPFEISCYSKKAAQTIELPAGAVSTYDIREGDELLVEDMR